MEGNCKGQMLEKLLRLITKRQFLIKITMEALILERVRLKEGLDILYRRKFAI